MDGLYRIETTGFAGWARLYGLARIPGLTRLNRYFSGGPENPPAFTRGFFGLLAVLLAGLGAWVLLSGAGNSTAESEPERLATAALTEPVQPPTPQNAQEAALPNPAPAALPQGVAADVAPVNGLKISSQSWRRGGLGSKALVTLTLRNGNDYAVKDIEILCSFTRRDGSHLTDRRRMIHETVNMKSRKTFTRMHVGFVNVNAHQARCSLVTASRI
ncbi:hypothetical protein [Bradyrhizobium sp.]|uniref:hypothetical protein n=1 Tax=Bradyrhizobium sp. TaxID=376 RepID=UPI0025C652F7|nr:hypothetical protein [Bradyrhizobium sp.]